MVTVIALAALSVIAFVGELSSCTLAPESETLSIAIEWLLGPQLYEAQHGGGTWKRYMRRSVV